MRSTNRRRLEISHSQPFKMTYMEIEVRVCAGIREMVAPKGFYLTQAEEAVENRIFCSRRVLLPGEQVGAWRVATAQEKAEDEAKGENEVLTVGMICSS